jgi:hypothetical protein
MNKKDKIKARKANFDMHLVFIMYFCILIYGHRQF